MSKRLQNVWVESVWTGPIFELQPPPLLTLTQWPPHTTKYDPHWHCIDLWPNPSLLCTCSPNFPTFPSPSLQFALYYSCAVTIQTWCISVKSWCNVAATKRSQECFLFFLSSRNLPDNPKAEWRVSLVTSIIAKHLRAHTFNMVCATQVVAFLWFFLR